MDIKRLSPDVSVSGQIETGDILEIARQGFKTIIANRPDGEGFGQPTAHTIEQTAEAAGLAFRYVPVVSGRMTANDVEAFRRAVAELPKPILAYCRSGARSTALYQASSGR